MRLVAIYDLLALLPLNRLLIYIVSIWIFSRPGYASRIMQHDGGVSQLCTSVLEVLLKDKIRVHCGRELKT